jgi:hypothetical protein
MNIPMMLGVLGFAFTIAIVSQLMCVIVKNKGPVVLAKLSQTACSGLYQLKTQG